MIDAQIERCKRLIERHGLTLLPYGPKQDGWVLDDGTTGTLLDARQFRPLLDDIRAGRLQVDCLVVFSLSRINRVDKVSKDQEKVRLSHIAAAEIKSALITGKVKVIDEEGENFTEEMIIRGSLERLVPVMMTALTAGLSLVPFILAADAPGKEILHPLAVVVLGGILTSTLLDQLVTPAVFYKFGKPTADRVIAEREGRTESALGDADVPPFGARMPEWKEE